MSVEKQPLNERILVVDDSAQVREYLAHTVLEAEGYQVDTASDGKEGLASVLATPPDLIITDLAMPKMNGLEMVEELRRRGHKMPVILITAEGSEELAVRALRAGVMDYFVKPFDIDTLLEAVQRILQAGRIGAIRAGVPDQRRLQMLNALIAVGKSVTSLLDLELILSRVVEAAVYLSGAEEGALMLLDPGSDDLYVRSAKNLDDNLVRTLRLPVQDSLAGRVVQTGEPLLVGGEGLQKIKTQYLVHSLLYVPLKVTGRVIGVLGVDNRSRRDISEEHIGVLAILADYAAIAIVNAQLFARSEAEYQKLERVLQQTRDVVLLVGEDGVIQLCNPVAQEALIRPGVDNPVGHRLNEVISNDDIVELFERESSPRGARGEIELPDGRTLNAQVSTIEGVGRVAVMQDITHLKELDRIKSEFVTTVSHDLRSPLTAILSYVDLLGRVGSLNERQQEFSQRVRQSVYSITDLINDLLELGKIEAGFDLQREPLHLEPIIARAIDSLQPQSKAKRHRLTVDIHPDVPQILGNALRLRQAVTNLVENAIKYTPEGGTITVSLAEEGGQVVLRVSDTGIGIPASDQPYIFDKFYRAEGAAQQVDGTGLGLSIVKAVVEAHGGRIWVDSRVDKGSTFTIVLDAYRRAESSMRGEE